MNWTELQQNKLDNEDNESKNDNEWEVITPTYTAQIALTERRGRRRLQRGFSQILDSPTLTAS